jgi:hypothetical protein
MAHIGYPKRELPTWGCACVVLTWILGLLYIVIFEIM